MRLCVKRPLSPIIKVDGDDAENELPLILTCSTALLLATSPAWFSAIVLRIRKPSRNCQREVASGGGTNPALVFNLPATSSLCCMSTFF